MPANASASANANAKTQTQANTQANTQVRANLLPEVSITNRRHSLGSRLLLLSISILLSFSSNSCILLLIAIRPRQALSAPVSASASASGSIGIGHGAQPFKACPPSSNYKTEKRRLFVATCDSRDGWKEFMALKTWNVTGFNLRTGTSEGSVRTTLTGIKTAAVPSLPLSMVNVCKAHAWGGFLTKPLLYLEWLLTIPPQNELGGDNHVILMDSDTFWAASDQTSIWNKYDCARQGKDLLLSTEMSCWVGRYCTQEDMHRYYNHTPSSPSFSPFLNSGVVMGKVNSVRHMLEVRPSVRACVRVCMHSRVLVYLHMHI